MSQRRRQRYTVVLLEEPQPRVILGYNAQNVVDYYNQQGKHVLKIEKGDHRKKNRAREAQQRGGFTIDSQALQQAKNILGLKLPVKIRFHARHGSTNGSYRFSGSSHDIMLKRYLTPVQATKTLWHELTHALQAERCGSYAAWAVQHEEQHGRYSYRNRPIEIEARRISDKMAPTHPLAR